MPVSNIYVLIINLLQTILHKKVIKLWLFTALIQRVKNKACKCIECVLLNSRIDSRLMRVKI